MRLKIFLLMAGLLFSPFVMAGPLGTIGSTLVRTFSVGAGAGQLGSKPNKDQGLGSVKAIAFDKSGNLYVVDQVNKRLAVFDSSFQFVKNIPLIPAYLNYLPFVSVDDSGDIIGEDYDDYVDYAPDGTLRVELQSGAMGKKFRVMKQGNVYYYYNKNDTLVGYVNPGPKWKVNEANKIVDSNAVRLALASAGLSAGPAATTSGNAVVNGQLAVPTRPAFQGAQVTSGGKIVSTRLVDFLAPDAWSKAKTNQSVWPGGSLSNIASFFDEEARDPSAFFLGSDNGRTSYWLGSRLFAVDATGQIKRVIVASNSLTQLAVAPDGNLYFMEERGNTYQLYKINRDW